MDAVSLPSPLSDSLVERYRRLLGLEVLAAEDIPEKVTPYDGLPLDFLQQHALLPLGIENGVFEMATAPPVETQVIDCVRQVVNLPLRLKLADRETITSTLERVYQSRPMDDIVASIDAGDSEGDDDDLESLKSLAEDAPVVRLVQMIMTNAVEARASDIHLEIFEDVFKVRYRIDGVLYDMESPPRRMFLPAISHLKLRARMNIAERRLPQDGRIKMNLHNRDIDMRVSTIPTSHGESMVIRLLDQGPQVLDLEMLGYAPEILKKFVHYINQPHGMILVTGPTGSGKTTSLYGALRLINTPKVKIITVEDPVEYQMAGVNQIQVRANIDLTFASALRAIVRQDPDVIMIGEIRDQETAEIAIQSALTGHLVFSTLHTNDSFGAPHRLLDMGVESYLIATSVLMILAQRLVRVICPHCKEEVEPSEAERLFIEQEGVAVEQGFHLYQGKGCSHCANTGYTSRTGIYELLPLTDGIKEAILKKASSEAVRRVAVAEGVLTMRADGIRKALLGQTTLEEVARVTRQDI